MTKMSASLSKERALAVIYLVFSRVFGPVSLLRDQSCLNSCLTMQYCGYLYPEFLKID